MAGHETDHPRTAGAAAGAGHGPDHGTSAKGAPAGSPGPHSQGPAPDGKKPPRQAGRYAYDGLQRVIHERSRLGILSSLAAHPDGLLFTDLKALCNLTDGNLSRQLQLLQETGFLQVIKGFKNNRPQTLCQLTDAGRERFLEYISVLESVVADAMAAPGASGASGALKSADGPAAQVSPA